MGVGEAEGENKAKRAVEAAIDSPLVEVAIDGARGVLINITGGPDLTMSEIEEAAKTITELSAPDANVIFGATIDKTFSDKIKISVIATGFDANRQRLYQNVKRPARPVQTTIEPQPSKTKEKPNLSNILDDKEIPDGIDIVDEFDIPSFLRKNK
jgi:cell division protein FtsZ